MRSASACSMITTASRCSFMKVTGHSVVISSERSSFYAASSLLPLIMSSSLRAFIIPPMPIVTA